MEWVPDRYLSQAKRPQIRPSAHPVQSESQQVALPNGVVALDSFNALARVGLGQPVSRSGLQWSNWVPSVPSRRPIEGPCVRNDAIDRENARCGETHDHLVVYRPPLERRTV